MPLPLVYHDDYSPPFPVEHRFPMEKFRLLYEHLQDSLPAADYHQPGLCPADILALAHDPAYIARYLAGELPREEQRRLGLPWSEALARRTVRAVGGSLLAAELALQHGLACNLAGGTHHAHYDQPSGFCIFNDLAVIARYLLASGRVGRVLIFDCDVHQGDGTARIFAADARVLTLSLHAERNYPARKARSDLDFPLPDGLGDAAYLEVLANALALAEPFRPGIVFYNAGVDPHAGDRLGRLALSDAGLRARDAAVIGWARARGLPLAGVLGGGYDHDPERLAARHAMLFEEAARAAAA